MQYKICLFLLKLFGWKIVGEYPHHLKKALLIAGPHTSNLDFPIGVFVRCASKAKTTFIAKSSLFKPPFGFIFRKLNGIPVDRSSKNNFVQSVVDAYNNREKLHLIIAPEGTRKKVDKLKSGFYYIAKGAEIPLVPILMDWEHKEFIFEKEFFVSNQSSETIMNLVSEKFASVKGKIPKNGIER